MPIEGGGSNLVNISLSLSAHAKATLIFGIMQIEQLKTNMCFA
jgi:hypothetical protein